jgi:hypothetical protein
MTQFTDLIGQTITKIEGGKTGSKAITFTLANGSKWQMDHTQDCYESVYVEDICGDLDDLIGSPIVRAEEPSSEGIPNFQEIEENGDYYDHHTWTFYILGTAKGTVTIRWLGESNGYYGEEVDFYELAQFN